MAKAAEASQVSKIRVGTSGWSYDHWRERFYPKGTPSGKWLPFYASRFPTVEINGTFYRLPSENAVKTWAEEVPPGFAFAVKGSRFITHFRKLAPEADEGVARFLDRVALLGNALDVVLWQLPPQLDLDVERLARFVGVLPREVAGGHRIRHAIEFRDSSWLVPAAFDVLRAHDVACVQIDSDLMPRDLTVTADFVYVRFHGRSGYHGSYQAPSLEPWAEFLSEQHASGRGGYVYFNNDAEGHAPADAARLASMLGDAAYAWPSPFSSASHA
jgi:uncharacterized protein YecE (DUF72 family)